MPFTDGVRGHTPYKFFGVLIPSSGRPAFYGGSQSLGVSPFYNEELNRTVCFLKTHRFLYGYHGDDLRGRLKYVKYLKHSNGSRTICQ